MTTFYWSLCIVCPDIRGKKNTSAQIQTMIDLVTPMDMTNDLLSTLANCMNYSVHARTLVNIRCLKLVRMLQINWLAC